MDKISIIILAAGASSRLGSAKQNLHMNHQTLLQNAIMAALAVSPDVSVVLGARKEEILPTIASKSVNILYNDDWESGIASSIRTGVSYYEAAAKQPNGLIIMLCDQPFVHENHLNQLIQAAVHSGKGIVASAYGGTVGVPVLFKAKYFQVLLSLKGDEGAKKVILQHRDDLDTLAFPEGAMDIDTNEDYDNLLRSTSRKEDHL